MNEYNKIQMTTELEPRRKYRFAGEPVLNNPLFDQSFDKQNSSVLSNEAKVQPEPQKQIVKEDKTKKTENSKSMTMHKSTKKKAPEYVGKSGEIYNFLKEGYQKRCGISFTIGGIHIDPKATPAEAETLRKERATKRAQILVDFWKQSFIKQEKKPESKSKVLDESRKTELSATQKEFKSKLKNYTEEEIAFTLTQDILKEINEAAAHAEKYKLQSKVLEENSKIEEEKRWFKKGLDLHYGFEKENSIDKGNLQLLVWTYREINMKFPVDGKELFEWWIAYPKREEKKINMPEERARELIDDFYSDKAKINRLEQLYKGVNKRFPKIAEELTKYWESIKVCSI